MRNVVLTFILTVGCIMSVWAAANSAIIRPKIESSNTTIIYIDEVSLDKDSTTIKFKAFYPPGYWIKVVSDSYLKIGDKKYPAKNGIGIILDEPFWMPKTGEAEFSVSFEPLPEKTKIFDFIEGDVDGTFKIEGINLTTPCPEETHAPLSLTETNMADIIELLKIAGYESYSFDLTPLLGKDYIIQLIEIEYENGKMINTSVLREFKNRTHVSDFPEENWNEILESGQCADPDNDIYSQCGRLSVMFQPVKGDSTRVCSFNFDKMGMITHNIKLKKVSDGQFEICNYRIKPFHGYTFKDLEFCPLLLLGSSWYDEVSGVFRFCGEDEISRDMSSSILKYIPHYYVIGIRPKPVLSAK